MTDPGWVFLVVILLLWAGGSDECDSSRTINARFLMTHLVWRSRFFYKCFLVPKTIRLGLLLGAWWSKFTAVYSMFLGSFLVINALLFLRCLAELFTVPVKTHHPPFLKSISSPFVRQQIFIESPCQPLCSVLWKGVLVFNSKALAAISVSIEVTPPCLFTLIEKQAGAKTVG